VDLYIALGIVFVLVVVGAIKVLKDNAEINEYQRRTAAQEIEKEREWARAHKKWKASQRAAEAAEHQKQEEERQRKERERLQAEQARADKQRRDQQALEEWQIAQCARRSPESKAAIYSGGGLHGAAIIRGTTVVIAWHTASAGSLQEVFGICDNRELFGVTSETGEYETTLPPGRHFWVFRTKDVRGTVRGRDLFFEIVIDDAEKRHGVAEYRKAVEDLAKEFAESVSHKSQARRSVSDSLEASGLDEKERELELEKFQRKLNDLEEDLL
jgi:hypothetical protein